VAERQIAPQLRTTARLLQAAALGPKAAGLGSPPIIGKAVNPDLADLLPGGVLIHAGNLLAQCSSRLFREAA
jgi:hypothetical protein